MITSVKKFTLRSAALIVLLLSVFTTHTSAQEVENDFQTRLGLDLGWGITDNLEVNLVSQFRRDETFAHESFTLDGGVTYRTFGFLYWGANYRLEIEPGIRVGTTYKYHRYAFSTMAKRKIDRFTTSFRIQYNNYGDEEIDDKEFLRYRLKTRYNLRNSKLTPYVAAEAFQELSESGMLYKMRYTAGADYKVFQGNRVYFDYKLDYYTLEYKNRHIFNIGYKISF